MKNYFAYYRKSTDTEDKQILSLDGQKEIVRDFAEKRGLHIVAEFKESHSAKKLGRPVFNEILQKLNSGKADGIIAYKADRLTRNYTDLGLLTSLMENDIEVWDTLYGEYKGDSNGYMMIGINTVMAKRKVDDLSEDTKRGLNQKATLGWMPGWAPTGYLNDKLTKTIIVDPNKAHYIKRAFELYSTDSHSLKDVVNMLSAEGFVARGGGKLSISTLQGILRNPFYTGNFRFNGKVLNGKHPQLVKIPLFDSVQAILNKRGRVNTRLNNDNVNIFPYRGLLVCGECGCSITAEKHNKTMKNGNKHSYIYYRCTKSKGKCSQEYIRDEKLEKQFAKLLSNITIDHNTATKIVEKLDELYKNDIDYQSRIESRLKASLTRLREEKKRLLRKMLAHDSYDMDTFDEVRQDIEKEISEIELKLRELSEHTAGWLDQSLKLVKLCKQADKLFLMGNLEQKRTLIECVASELTLNAGIIDYTYKKPFDALVKARVSLDWGD